MAKLLSEFSNNQLHNYVKIDTKFEIARQLRELLKIYQLLDSENTKVRMKSINISSHFNEIKAAKLIRRKNDEGGNPQEFVRECFKAMVKKIRATSKHLTGTKKAAMEYLLTNMEISGLMQPGKIEPTLQKFYTYDQYNKDSFINWQIELITTC